MVETQTPFYLEILFFFEEFNEINKKVVAPDFNIKDSDGQTVLSLCLWNNLIPLAKKLIGIFFFE